MGDKSPEKRNSALNIKVNLPEQIEKNTLWISFFLVLMLTAIAYGAVLRNGFVWDDETFIVTNSFVHDLSRWPEYFTNSRSVSSDPVLSRMYRPLQTLSFAIDAALWNNRAGGFHFTSLILHIASCIAIIFAFRTLVGNKPAFLAACIFAIHPSLSEGVLSLASRGNQLYALFGLLSIGFFLRITKPFDLNHIFSTLTLALSLFSKEPAIALIALLPFVQLVSEKPRNIRSMQSVLLYIPFLITAVIYLVMRSMVVEAIKVIPYWGGSLWATLQMQSKVFVIYLRLLLWPFILKGRYTIALPASFPDPFVTGAVLLNLALIIFGIFIYRRGSKGKLIALAIAWFYVSLAPVSNLIPVPGSMMGERFLYFTFAGVIPLLAGALQDINWKRFQYTVLIFGIGLSAVWLAKDILRTSDWRDNSRFFAVLSKQEPDNPVVQLWIAQEELASQNTASALNRIERIMQIENTAPLPEDRAKLHYWYGKALLDSNRPRDAYREFSIVVKLKQGSPTDIVLLLAESAARSGELETARSILEKEIKSSPKDDFLWNGLGNALMMTGDISGAISSYKQAVEINPRNSEAAVNLQNAFKAKPPSNTYQSNR